MQTVIIFIWPPNIYTMTYYLSQSITLFSISIITQYYCFSQITDAFIDVCLYLFKLESVLVQNSRLVLQKEHIVLNSLTIPYTWHSPLDKYRTLVRLMMFYIACFLVSCFLHCCKCSLPFVLTIRYAKLVKQIFSFNFCGGHTLMPITLPSWRR